MADGLFPERKAHHAFRNTASLLNVSKLHRDFTSRGLAVSKNTLFEYLGCLEDSFLIFLLPRREASLRKQAHNPRKLHVVDAGLSAAFQAYPTRDQGPKLETTVFLRERRRAKELFYYANGSEVNLCDGSGGFFVNTCWNLADPETLRREKAAMAFGTVQWPMASGLLLFHEYAPGLEQAIPGAQDAPCREMVLRDHASTSTSTLMASFQRSIHRAPVIALARTNGAVVLACP